MLPGSNRRKGLLAAADGTNIDLTIFDGVLAAEVPKAEIPEVSFIPSYDKSMQTNEKQRWGEDDYNPSEGVLGCLMSHLRIWRRIIDENLSSVLGESFSYRSPCGQTNILGQL